MRGKFEWGIRGGRLLSAGVVALLLACGRSPSRARAGAIASRESPVAAAAPAAPSASVGRVTERAQSFAIFDNDVLDECVDFAVRATPPPGAPGRWRAREPDTSEFAKLGSRIPKPCGEQFADRTPLGTCTVRNVLRDDAGAQADFLIVNRFYGFDRVGASDAAMKECLEMHAEWNSLPRDSHEFHRAKLEYDVRRLEKVGSK